MEKEKQLTPPEKSASDEATGSETDEERNLLQEIFSKGIFEILVSGDPKNLSGDERVEQEKRIQVFMGEFGSKAEKLFSESSPECNKSTASWIRSIVPPQHQARVEAFLREFKIVDTDEPQKTDTEKS